MSYVLAAALLCKHNMIYIVTINQWVLNKFLNCEDFSEISILQWLQFCLMLWSILIMRFSDQADL